MSNTIPSNLENFSRIKFYCDTNRCIECHGCDVACKEAHHLPVGVNRRRVVMLNEGVVGKETAVSIACMHCSDAPCAQVCPVDCFYIRADGIVLHDKKTCIGCGYCLYACPFGAPQFQKMVCLAHAEQWINALSVQEVPKRPIVRKNIICMDKTELLKVKCQCVRVCVLRKLCLLEAAKKFQTLSHIVRLCEEKISPTLCLMCGKRRMATRRIL